MKRRTSLATLGGAALLVATSLTLGSQPAIAADHADGPALDSNAAADIADLYAWMESGSTTLTLIMTINGTVSGDVQYAFHVGRQDTALNAAIAPSSEVTDIICTTTDGTDAQCWVGNGDPDNGGDYLSGDVSAAAGLASDSGNTTVHIGTHADPFFFFADGFTSAITAANFAAGADIDTNFNLSEEDYPEAIDGGAADALGTDCGAATDSAALVLVDMLAGNVSYDAMTNTCADEDPSVTANNFAGQNVDAIVVEVDTSLIGGTTENAFLQIWASTHDGM